MKFESLMMNSRGKPRKPPSRKFLEMAIKNFEERGHSAHTPYGHILCHILNHCVKNGIEFTLFYHGRIGYSLMKG